MRKSIRKRPHIAVVNETKPAKPPGILEQIRTAPTHDEVDRLLLVGLGSYKRNKDLAYRFHCEAVKRKEQLSRP